MHLTSAISLAVISYCASLVNARATIRHDNSPIYGEHEHIVHKPHPHFQQLQKRSPIEAIAVPVDFDTAWLWKDPETCGYTHGEPFNWIKGKTYRFRHNFNGKDSEFTHFHMWAGDRINSIKIEWTDKGDGSVVGHGGEQVEYSPLELDREKFYINGMVAGCCKKGGLRTRLCYAQITTNKGGELNTLEGGKKPDNWRTSKPACCKAVAAYGRAGAEIDSFQFYYLKRETYNAKTEPMPGYPGQPKPPPSSGTQLRRRAFIVGEQSNERVTSTPILGDHNPDQYSVIDHSVHAEDNYRISKIVTYCSDRVEGIQLTYTDLNNPSKTRESEFHGLKVGQLREMELSKGDYVHTVDNSDCRDSTGRSQVCGLVFHTYLMQQHACGRSTSTGESQSIGEHAMLSITGAHEGEVLKSIGINWIPVEDHH